MIQRHLVAAVMDDPPGVLKGRNMDVAKSIESIRETLRTRLDQESSERKSLEDRLDSIEKAFKDRPAGGGGGGDHRSHDPTYKGVFPNADMARHFGALCLSVLSQNGNVRERSAQIVADGGYKFRTHKGETVKSETFVKDMGISTDTGGGYLVPAELADTVIRNVEMFGVARKHLTVVPMAREQMFWPKRTNGFTVYYPDEHQAVTKSDLSLGRVQLTAKKWAVATVISKELDEDSLVAIGEFIALEMALAIAQAEDKNAFMGDGTSVYAGIVGVLGSPNTMLEVMDATETSFDKIAPKHLTRLVTNVPTWAKTKAADPAYYMSPEIYGLVMLLEDQAGRPIYRSNQTEGFEMKINGYPVREVHAMPGLAASAISTDFVAFGSLRLWGYLGERRAISIERSTELFFMEDQIAIKAVPRQDIQETDGTAMTVLRTAAA